MVLLTGYKPAGSFLLQGKRNRPFKKGFMPMTLPTRSPEAIFTRLWRLNPLPDNYINISQVSESDKALRALSQRLWSPR